MSELEKLQQAIYICLRTQPNPVPAACLLPAMSKAVGVKRIDFNNYKTRNLAHFCKTYASNFVSVESNAYTFIGKSISSVSFFLKQKVHFAVFFSLEGLLSNFYF